MRIGVDIRPLMSSHYSGVSWYVFYLLKNLLAIDQKNQYILFYNSSKNPTIPLFEQDNVSYRRFYWPNKFFNLAIAFTGHPKLDQLLDGVDVFFSPNFNFVSLSDNCRQIITVHDLSFKLFPEFFSYRMRLWHKLAFKKKMLDRVEVIVADSENTKLDLINLLGVKPGKIEVIYLGIDEKFHQIKDQNILIKIKNKYNLPDKFYLYLGSIEPRKNIEGIVEAFNNLNNDFDLVIVGGGGWKNKKVNRLISQNSKIKLINGVEELDKPAIYNLATALVYPSFYEGFGLPPLEAMACGCPVVAGANSGQLEVVADAGLLVNSWDVNEIKAAMDLVVKDDELRQLLISKGLDQATRFSWKKSAEVFLSILNKN